MVGKIFNQDDSVRFVESSHQYFAKDGRELTSVTTLIKKIVKPFDRAMISSNMAKAMAKETGRTKESCLKEILGEWDQKRDSASDRGNWIHKNLENYLLHGTYDDKLKDVVTQLQPIFKNNYRFYTEALIHSMDHLVAGQSDLVVQRQKTDNSLFDFFDYKTNESKGIEFDSIARKKDPVKHYNKFFLPPFDYLEDCNFTQYSLQLSLYAYMSSITWGIKVGKLAILFVDNNLKLHVYPVPYMMLEAKMLLDHKVLLKPLPTVSSTQPRFNTQMVGDITVSTPNPKFDQREKDEEDW